jgi:5-methylcytosine-specific restriction endonuclease McrA
MADTVRGACVGDRTRPCAVDGCERIAGVPGSARGWCGLHYQRWKKHGDVHYTRPIRVGVVACSIEGCQEVVKARDWCVKHWTRWKRYGDAEARMPGEVRDGCRICPRCRQDKPLGEYSAPGHAYCRRCYADLAAARRTDPLVRQRDRSYYFEVWRVRNPDYHRERIKEWRSRNPDQVRAHRMQRRARLVAAVTEPFGPQEIFERDDWTCGICEQPISPVVVYPDPMSPSLDHVVPLARGGAHNRENCQATHLICNVRKGARGSA